MSSRTGQVRLMIVISVPFGTPSARPVSSKTRHGDGSVTSWSPPNTGFSARSP